MGEGPVLIVESSPAANTAAVGVWVCRGSCHEPDELAGATHLLEHLLLRRCGRRTPGAIARLIDSLGGDVNAYTTRETCAVTANVPAGRFVEALNLVLDAVLRPVIRDRDLAIEQGVVAAEFDVVQDSPAETVAERALQACWGGHPMARPVLGRREVVRHISAEQLTEYHRIAFVPSNLIVVAVGPVSDTAVAARIPWEGRSSSKTNALPQPEWHRRFLLEERAGLEQVYANLVLPALPADHPDAFALGVLHQLLGGGTSSRLFRELRDRRGLVYEVESSLFTTAGTGLLEVTFSTPVRHVRSCWDAVLAVLEQVAEGRISSREVDLARQALVSSLILGSEGCDGRLEAYAGEWLTRRRRYDRRTLELELAQVTPDHVREVAVRLVRLENLAGALCGPAEGLALPAWLTRRVA